MKITPRGVLLSLVLFALAVTAVYPLRSYLAQGDRIDRLEAKQRALESANRQLSRERERLHDPAYVEQLAKRDYHMVRPGEEAWVLVGEPPTAQPEARAETGTPAWYERAWQWLTDLI